MCMVLHVKFRNCWDYSTVKLVELASLLLLLLILLFISFKIRDLLAQPYAKWIFATNFENLNYFATHIQMK